MGSPYKVTLYQTGSATKKLALASVTLSPELAASLLNTKVTFQFTQIIGGTGLQSLTEVQMLIGEEG